MSEYAKDRPHDDSAFERMRYYLREIGQGPKNCRDLTREEARDVMEMILARQATDAQMGASFLSSGSRGSRRRSCWGSPTPFVPAPA